MDKEILDVICYKDAIKINAVIELFEYDEDVEIKLYLTDVEYVSRADNFFEALLDIRKNSTVKILSSCVQGVV